MWRRRSARSPCAIESRRTEFGSPSTLGTTWPYALVTCTQPGVATLAPFEPKDADLNDIIRETVDFLSALAVPRQVESRLARCLIHLPRLECPTGENAPGDAGELVGECDRQHVVM